MSPEAAGLTALLRLAATKSEEVRPTPVTDFLLPDRGKASLPAWTDCSSRTDVSRPHRPVLNHALTPKENTVRTRFVLPVVLAGVLLSQHACAGQADQSGTASSTSGLGSAGPAVTSLAAPVATPAQSPTKLPASPAKATSAAAGGVLSGTRQVYILPENNEATVAVDKAMKAGLSEDFDNRALFVFKPDGDRYSIRTAKLRVNDDPTNETFCLVVRSGKVVAVSVKSNETFDVSFSVVPGLVG